MKRILLIFVVAVTLVFMVFPVSAVDGGNAEIEELSDLLDEELIELSENTDLEHFDLVCYDPLINNLNNEEDYIEEPEDELLEEDLIAPYVIGNPDEIDDKELELNSLTVGQLLNQDDGTHFKNLVSVGDETNVSYLNILLDQKYPDCKNIRIHIQGSCSDGEYVYNALNIEYGFNNLWQKESCIVSGVYDENDNFVTTAIRFTSDMIQEGCLSQKDDLKHTNGITYNGLHDKLVIACAEQGHHNEVYSLDADYFRGETEILPLAQKYEVSCMLSSIAYNEKRNRYVGLVYGSDMHFVYFDSDFNIIGAFDHSTELDDPYNTSYVGNQGICCDDNYIYATYFIQEGKEDVDVDNVMVMYDWEGKKIAEFTLETESVQWTNNKNITLTSKYEIEGISILNDRIVLGFNVFWRDLNNEKDKTTFLYLYDLSELCFNIKYCPDDNVANYVNANSLKSNTVLYNQSTKLLKNTYMKTGYKFKGWHLYSPETNKWRYSDVEGENWKWCVEGTQPEGYIKGVYPENTLVKHTVPAGMNVLFCAAWEETDKFYITYDGNGATGGSTDAQEITYGVSEPLNVGGFTKTVNNNQVAFLGWNPYCPETGKWYYANSDASQRGWYIEGEEPIGFSKALYANAGTVSKTTKAGGHIVLFAVWNEFTIYYDAAGKMINAEDILLPTIVQKGIPKSIDKYTPASVSTADVIPNRFNGYHQYIVEIERWRYYNDQDSSIWLPDSDLPLYTYTGNIISDGLNAGWHVIFSADWS